MGTAWEAGRPPNLPLAEPSPQPLSPPSALFKLLLDTRWTFPFPCPPPAGAVRGQAGGGWAGRARPRSRWTSPSSISAVQSLTDPLGPGLWALDQDSQDQGLLLTPQDRAGQDGQPTGRARARVSWDSALDRGQWGWGGGAAGTLGEGEMAQEREKAGWRGVTKPRPRFQRPSSPWILDLSSPA